MLTLGWAVDQSRRAFRAKSRGSRVHPDGRRTASSSRGGDGTPGTPTRGAPREMDDAGARSPKSPRRVPPGAGPGTCLGAVIALMGFGRGGTKAIAAAERAREAARSGKLRGVPRLASTPEHRATPSRASRGGSSSRLGSESRRHRRTPRTAKTDDGTFTSSGGPPPPSRSASMRFAPAPGRSRRAARFVERPEPGVARHGGSERGDGRGSFDARARGPVRGRRLERSAGDARGAQGALLVDALGQKPVADWVVTSRGGGNNDARDSLAVIRSHFRFRRRRALRGARQFFFLAFSASASARTRSISALRFFARALLAAPAMR